MITIRLRQQIDRPGLFDRVVDLAMQLSGNTRHPARKNLAGLGGELGKKLGISRYDEVGGNIMPAARHHAVRLTKVDSALDCFWLGHGSGGAC